MKRFIFKGVIFLLPIIFIFCFTEIFYSTNKGDLIRIGYLADFNTYNRQEIFSKEFQRKIYFTNISEIDLSKQHNYKILIIGDSFSEQGNYGYKNYLAEYSVNSVLVYDKKIQQSQSPLKTLTGLLNGNVFDNIKVDYIILQVVERHFVESSINLTKRGKITLDSLKVLIEINKTEKKEKNADKLFSGRIKNFLSNNFYYLFDDNAHDSETYKVATSERLFSINKNELLFYYYDIKSIEVNNNLEKINQLNNDLNML